MMHIKWARSLKIQKVQKFKMRKVMIFDLKKMKIPDSMQPTMRKLRLWKTFSVADMQSERIKRNFEKKFEKYRKTQEGQREKRKLK